MNIWDVSECRGKEIMWVVLGTQEKLDRAVQKLFQVLWAKESAEKD